MGLSKEPTECRQAGTWIWWVEENRFLGDEIVADLFNVDRTALKAGVPIETIRQAVHPDDLASMLAAAQASIEADRRYRSNFRVCRRDGLIRNVASFGHCFFENGRLIQFAGTTVELGLAPPSISALDRLTDQVIAARETARFLEEPFHVHLLEMILADLGTVTAKALMTASDGPSSSH